jgi:hypothetical protein
MLSALRKIGTRYRTRSQCIMYVPALRKTAQASVVPEATCLQHHTMVSEIKRLQRRPENSRD